MCGRAGKCVELCLDWRPCVAGGIVGVVGGGHCAWMCLISLCMCEERFWYSGCKEEQVELYDVREGQWSMEARAQLPMGKRGVGESAESRVSC